MTQIIRTINEWRKIRKTLLDEGKTVGFVPTMGALHEGHASLVEKSKQENDVTLVSIFVNPTQFNDPNDLARYPRTFESDYFTLEKLGAEYVFAPNASELYPDDYRFRVSENRLSTILCGKTRPGHFDGVLTVVLKLLNIAEANRAYFGEKDYQQYLLISEMAAALFLKTEIIPCQTIRESSGLAMSSRNTLLNEEDRKTAAEFHRILKISETTVKAREELEKRGFEVDYVEDHFKRRLAAIRFGSVRLIDNVQI